MPSLGRWAGIGVLAVSPLAFAGTDAAPEQTTAQATPSADLLEFIADWNREERELLTMDDKTDSRQTEPAPQAPGGRSAP